MINFLIGRSNTGKSEFIFNNIKSNINSDINIYYQVPEQMTLEAEKKITSIIDIPIFNIKITSFERLSQEILSRVGGINREFIDDIGTLMILKYISVENINNFNTYSNSVNKAGFLENMSEIISEFQKSGYSPEDLGSKIQLIDEKNSIKNKLIDINFFYKKYLEYTNGVYLDSDSRLILLVEKLQNSDYLNNSMFYFDKFFSYNSLEFDVIKVLFSKNIDITFSIDLDSKHYNNYNECFDITKKTFDSLLNLAKNMNLDYEIINFEKSILNNPEIQHLEHNFSSFYLKPYEKKQNSIFFHESENPEKEISNLCQNIINLVQNENYKFNDIRVFCPDPFKYKDVIEEYFSKFEIPFYLDIKKSPSELSISRIIFAFLDLFINNFDQKSIISFYKTSLTDINKEKYFLLENFLTRWNIHIFSKKLNKDSLAESLFDEYNDTQKEKILESINYIKNINEIYKNSLSKKENTVENFISSILNFIEKSNLKEKINDLVKSLTIAREYEYASFLSQSWNEIIDVLNQIDSCLSNTKISLVDFKTIIYQGINSKKISTIPPTVDTVIISDVLLTRYYYAKVAFFIGFSDTLLPKINENSDLLIEDDKLFLNSIDINLISSIQNSFQEENMNLYHLISKVQDKIYFSYSIKDINKEDAKRSSYLSQIIKIIPNINYTNDIGKNRLFTSNKKLAFENLYKSFEEDIRYNSYDDDKLALAKYFLNDEDYNNKSEVYLDTLFYKNKIVKINKKYIPSIYKLPLETSITRLENFNGCPFRHFMDYGIKPEERKTAIVDFLDIGTILHKSIENFASKLKNNEISNTISDETLEKEIEKIYSKDNFLEKRVSILKDSSKKNSYKFKKIKKISRNASKLLLKQIKNSKFKIRKIEEKIKSKDIKINNTGNKNYDYIYIKGKVDRIDEYISEDGKYITIIDYKSSNKDLFLSDIYNGLNIQMPVYIYILTEDTDNNPAAIIYFPMTDNFIKTNLYKKEEIEQIALKKNFQMKGFFLNEEKVLEALDVEKSLNSDYLDIKKPSGRTTQSNLINKEDMNVLLEFTIKSIKKTCQKMLDGIIKPYPVRRKSDNHSECQYCRYKNICKFDINLDGFSYKEIEKTSTDDTLEMMKGE